MLENRQKTVYLLLVVCILILCPAALQADADKVSGLEGHWAENTFQKWMKQGVIQSTQSEIRPDDSITRAEFAAILNRVIRYQSTGAPNFSDLSKDAWYYEDVCKLHHAGVLKGYDDSTVRPQGQLSREEAAVLLARAFQIEDSDVKLVHRDADRVSAWAQKTVQGMVGKNYLSGDSLGNLNPQTSISRAEALTIVDRLCSRVILEDGDYSGTIDGNLVICSRSVKLKDMKVLGDLYIMEGVGEGDVYLDNVQVEGKTFVRGGGSNSLHLRNCVIKELVASKEKVHLVLSNGTKISFLRADIKDGIIDMDACRVETMTIFGTPLKLRMNRDAKIETLNSDVNNTVVEGKSGAKITNANLNGKTNIKGPVSIDTANIQMDGCSIERAPKVLNLKKDISVSVGGVKNGEAEQNNTSSSVSSSSSSPSGSEIETIQSHDVPNLRNIPFQTPFEELNLPQTAVLSSTKGNRVEVNLTWIRSDYRSNLVEKDQRVRAEISPRIGSLPSWVPEKLSITVRVLDVPAPQSFVLLPEQEEYTIVKNSVETFPIQVKDENGTIMGEEALEQAGVILSHSPIPDGLEFTGNRKSIRIKVPENFEEESFNLNLRLIHKKGEISKTLLIKTPNAPQNKVQAVTDLELYESYINLALREGPKLNLRYRVPDEVSDIKRFELLIEKEDDPEHVKSTYFLSVGTPGMVNEFDLTNYFLLLNDSQFPSGTYLIKVKSVARGSSNSQYDNLALCDYKVKFEKEEDLPGSLPGSIVIEKLALTGIHQDKLNVVLDYHFKDILTPDVDTFFAQVQSMEANLDSNTESYGHIYEKGRLRLDFPLSHGTAQIDVAELIMKLKRYRLKFQDKLVTLSMSALEVPPIEEIGEDQIGHRDVYRHFLYGSNNTSGEAVYKKNLGTKFEDLGLPTEIGIVKDVSENPISGDLQVTVVWEEGAYDNMSTELQNVRGRVNYQPPHPSHPDQEPEVPAWIPEYVEMKVLLE